MSTLIAQLFDGTAIVEVTTDNVDAFVAVPGRRCSCSPKTRCASAKRSTWR